jgi:hypothetical protein
MTAFLQVVGDLNAVMHRLPTVDAGLDDVGMQMD